MAEAHAKHHDYHLVPPSPWPFIGSMSAFAMAIGAVMWMKAMPLAGIKLGPVVFFAGLIGVLYTMYGWWADVIKEGQQGDHTRVVSLHLRYGMIMFIASEVMFFVAWFWAFFDAALFPGEVHQFQRTELTGGHWPPKGIECRTFSNLRIQLPGGLRVLQANRSLHSRTGNQQVCFKLVKAGTADDLIHCPDIRSRLRLNLGQSKICRGRRQNNDSPPPHFFVLDIDSLLFRWLFAHLSSSRGGLLSASGGACLGIIRNELEQDFKRTLSLKEFAPILVGCITAGMFNGNEQRCC